MSAAQEYFRLLRLHLRMQLGLSALNAGRGRRRSGKETAKVVGIGLLMLYVVGVVLFVYGFILFPLLRAAADMGLQVPVMGVIVLICMMVTLLFGTLTLLSLVFGARDAEFYAALPLREQSVFAAKFTIVYGIEAGMSAVFLWPAAVIYGIVTHLNAGDFALLILRLIPVWLLLPAVPLALAAVLSIVFVRLTALARHRDTLLIAIGFVFVLVCAVGPSMLSSRVAMTLSDESAVLALLSDNSAMLKAATSAFPPAAWCAQALVGGSAAETGVSFLGMFAAVAAATAICLLLSRRLYYKGVLAQLEAPRGKKRGFSRTGVKTSSALKAFFAKEVRVIVRTPVYAMNILTGVIIFPIMLAVGAFGGGVSLSPGMGGLRDIIAGLRGVEDQGLLCLIAAGIVMLMSVMCMGISTTFSREGNALWLSQIVPVPVRTQIAARLLAGYAFTVPASVLSLAIMVAFLGFSPAEAVFGLVAGTCVSFPLLSAALIPDALRPKRKWNSEAEAIKQNFNSVVAMLIDMGLAALIGFAGFGLQLVMSVWVVGILLSLAGLAVGYALFCYTVRTAERMMKTVDG